jgi:hypothetical protein
LPGVVRRLRRYTSVDLLICDELGYQPIDAHAVDLLFQIISRRHEQASTVSTTNLAFKDWSNVFPGAPARPFAALPQIIVPVRLGARWQRRPGLRWFPDLASIYGPVPSWTEGPVKLLVQY